MPARIAVLLGLLLLTPALCAADHIAVISDDSSAYEFGSGIEYILDSDDRYSWQTISSLREENWSTARDPVLSFGFTDASLWLRFSFENQSSLNRFFLELAAPLLDSIEMLIEVNGNTPVRHELGDMRKFADRAISDTKFVVPIDLQSHESASIIIKVQSESAMQIPVRLYTPGAFFQSKLANHGLYGAFFGIMIVMAIYNLFIYFTVRHLSYFLYSIMVFTCALFIATIEGLAFHYLWPELPEINKFFPPLILGILGLSSVLFSTTLLSLRTLSRPVYLLNIGYAILFLVLMVLSLTVSYRVAIVYGSLIGAGSSLLMIFNGIYSVVRGGKQALYYIFALSAVLIMFLFLALSKIGLVELPLLSEYAVPFGSVIAVILFSFALADRINQAKAEKLLAQEDFFKSQQEVNQEKQRNQDLRYQAEIEELLAQQKIMEVEAENEAKSEFLATMSHEIRTPMNGVLGITELLRETRLDAQQKNYLDTIANSGELLLSVINDILDYSRISAGKLVLDENNFNLRALCAECVSLIQVKVDSDVISLYCDIQDDIAQVIRADSTRIRQVLVNLLGNAVKFTKAGSIRLEVAVDSATDTPHLCFAVIDTGIGIDEEARDKLFLPFSQADSSTSRHYGGSGLGLSICRGLVELMNGEIGVDSEPGAGSRFWFSIPLVIPATESVEAASQAKGEKRREKEAFRNRHVLVAEDNETNQLVISGMLKKLGVSYEITEDGLETVDSIESNHDGYDLILMDCEMPEMDGYEASSRIREFEQQNELRQLPILALTAHALPAHKEKVLERGMNDHLSKPVRLALLEKMLTKHFPASPRSTGA